MPGARYCIHCGDLIEDEAEVCVVPQEGIGWNKVDDLYAHLQCQTLKALDGL